MRFDSLGNICTTVTDYVANGSFKALKENVSHKNAQDGYAILIRLADYRNKFKGPFEYIDRHGYNFLSKTKLYGNEIIISNVGAHLGTVFRTPTLGTPMSLGPNAILLKTKYIDDYYYYFFTSKKGQALLKTIVSGSAQPKFNKTDLKKLIVPIPSLDEQNKISRKLLAIDKKIQINEQINANLQELRHILYKQLIAQSALKTISIKELYSIKYGKTLPKSQLLRTGTKVFGAKGFMGYTERKPLVNKATVTITSRGSGAGFVSYIDEEEAFLTNNLLYLIDKTGLGLSFTYELIKSSKPSQFVTGSAQPQLTINNLKQLKLKIPTDRFIIEQFKNNTKRIEDCMSNNKIENNSLQKLRLAFLNYYF